MKSLLRLLLKTQHQRNRSGPPQTDKGMTLIELLIGMVMAFLIITPMLAFVVDMLNTDRREQVKANTEQDIQAAVDYIAQDLSQAIYIYDNAGITAINASPTPLPSVPNATPILVFWKRQLQRNALPLTPTAPNDPAPRSCDPDATPGAANECNDTYVLSLVAYYQVREPTPTPNSTWCQPSGSPCPTRIARYHIRDGLKDPRAADPATNPYYTVVKQGQERSDAYNRAFDISKPLENVTIADVSWDYDVLVNYIHHNTVNLPTPDDKECEKALGEPTTQVGATTTKIPEETLKIGSIPTTPANFYACVDTARNLARVTIRGNSLRRLQNNADYNPNNSAYFPTATVQVQGLGARGN
jgi:type II secretory pathway pseudopilin PulG